MSILLLDKTRKINKLLHNNNSTVFIFSDICNVLADILKSNVLFISSTGKVLGIGSNPNINQIEEYLNVPIKKYIDGDLNERLLEVLSTKENVNLETLGFDKEKTNNYYGLITPIDIAGERHGTLFVYRTDSQYNIEDIILAEYGSTVVGLEMIRSISDENDRNTRNRNVLDGAIKSLSISERKAIKVMFTELNGTEGIVVASKIAKTADITRSVIVNALKKFESAGLIETHSNGMKGTHIKIKNETLLSMMNLL